MNPSPELLAAARAHYEAITRVPPFPGQRWLPWDELPAETISAKCEAMRAAFLAVREASEDTVEAMWTALGDPMAAEPGEIFTAIIDCITRDGGE